MALTATIFSPDADERRGSNRRAIARASTLRDAEAQPYAVLVEDLSAEGVSVIAGIELLAGSDISIGLPGVGRREAQVVRVSGNRYGCRFDAPLSAEMLATAFAADPVVDGGFARLPDDAAGLDLTHEPEVEKWPRAARLALLVGSCSLLWAAVFRLF